MKKYIFKNLLYLGLSLLIFSCTSPIPTPDKPTEEDNLSAYITDVYEYIYAPGQHAKTIKPEDKKNFIGEPYYDVYLGVFGGYIIAGFDHNVMNVAGEADFEVYSVGVSPEPAIVYVMSDENENGLPDDTWYELKGSEYSNESTIYNYAVTYRKAADENSNITWTDNKGNAGELKNGLTNKPTASWWWSGTAEDEITLTGTRLPDAYHNTSAEGEEENWTINTDLFKWGYAENNFANDYFKETKANKLDIANAVDQDGNPKNLPHIRFIKIQTAVFQQAGWLNEISSEVQGARDLHYKK